VHSLLHDSIATTRCDYLRTSKPTESSPTPKRSIPLFSSTSRFCTCCVCLSAFLLCKSSKETEQVYNNNPAYFIQSFLGAIPSLAVPSTRETLSPPRIIQTIVSPTATVSKSTPGTCLQQLSNFGAARTRKSSVRTSTKILCTRYPTTFFESQPSIRIRLQHTFPSDSTLDLVNISFHPFIYPATSKS